MKTWSSDINGSMSEVSTTMSYAYCSPWATSFYDGIMASLYSGLFLKWRYFAMISLYNDTAITWSHLKLVSSYHALLLKSYHHKLIMNTLCHETSLWGHHVTVKNHYAMTSCYKDIVMHGIIIEWDHAVFMPIRNYISMCLDISLYNKHHYIRIS